MVNQSSKFQKRDFLFGGCITAIIIAIGGLLWIIGMNTDVFDPIGKAINNYHISDIFFYVDSRKHRTVENVNHGVIIVDIHDCDSRREIAEIVNKIKNAKPRVLAVDIIFGEAVAISSEEDSLLKSAFNGIPNLVIASRCAEGIDGWHTERSFFADQVNCVEGDVNFDNGIMRSFFHTQSLGTKEVTSLVAQVAKKGGICDFFQEQLINYCPVRTITLYPEDLIDTELLTNQIVLLGDGHDLRDYHDIPVLINGSPRTSGLNIIAQCLYSLRPGNGFQRCPQWLDILIGLLLTYIFCTFISSPKFRIGQFNGFWISIWQVVVLLILISLTYVVFWKFHYCFSLKYWLVGVGLSGLATEFFYFILPKRFRL